MHSFYIFNPTINLSPGVCHSSSSISAYSSSSSNIAISKGIAVSLVIKDRNGKNVCKNKLENSSLVTFYTYEKYLFQCIYVKKSDITSTISVTGSQPFTICIFSENDSFKIGDHI